MTVKVEWLGKTYDIDPLEMSTREIDLIEQRTGLKLSDVASRFLDEANAGRALFWIVDRREDPTLDFSTYDGPPMRIIVEVGAEFYRAVLGVLGKAAAALPSAEDGSPSSPSDTPGAPPQPLTY